MYRNIAINQCGFSTTMDIGYGNCTPSYVDTATSIQFCICSTNRCSDTYSTCQTSVNQALSSPPPLIPVLQPTLSNTITCQDYLFNFSVIYNYTSPMYRGCDYLTILSTPDYSKCYSYTPNHTVICYVLYDPTYGSSDQLALIQGAYETFMLEMIEDGALSTNISLGVYQYQTSTSIATIYPSNSGPYNMAYCLCTTNNFNSDLATCTQGMNIPSYLLSYNGSTSLISTVSTSSISSGTTRSSGSTTRPLSNTSSLLSSAATSTTISITVSSTSLGHRNNSSSAAPYPSFVLITAAVFIMLD